MCSNLFTHDFQRMAEGDEWMRCEAKRLLHIMNEAKEMLKGLMVMKEISHLGGAKVTNVLIKHIILPYLEAEVEAEVEAEEEAFKAAGVTTSGWKCKRKTLDDHRLELAIYHSVNEERRRAEKQLREARAEVRMAKRKRKFATRRSLKRWLNNGKEPIIDLTTDSEDSE